MNTYQRDNLDWLKAALTTSGITSDSALSKLKGALYGVRAIRSTNQSISDSTDTSVQFSATDAFDSDAFHDTSTNNQRITIPSGGGGYYLLGGGITFDASSAGIRTVYLEVNGTAGGGTLITGSRSRQTATSSGEYSDTVMALYQLAAGDYVAMTVRQTSGGALNLTSAAFWAYRVFAI
jgi:hypothetical protein